MIYEKVFGQYETTLGQFAKAFVQFATTSGQCEKVFVQFANVFGQYGKTFGQYKKVFVQFATTFGHFRTTLCKLDNSCIMTKTLITQAATPLLTSVSTFCFSHNANLQTKKNKKSLHF